MKVTFLGTGNAMPTKLRNHPGILLTRDGENLLIDCGEGTQRQLRMAEENPCKITRILLTHLHGDHVLGLPGLMKTLEMSQYAKTLKIYGPSGTRKHIALLEELYGKIKITHEVHEGSGTIIDEKEFMVQALPMSHGIATQAYAFIVKDRRHIDKAKLKKMKVGDSPLLKNLQNGKDITIDGKKLSAKALTYVTPGKKVAFILDTGENANTLKIAKDADILVCESTYSAQETETAKEHKHLTSEQAAKIAKKANVKKLILTHLSQRYENEPEKIRKEASKTFKNVFVVKELESIEI